MRFDVGDYIRFCGSRASVSVDEKCYVMDDELYGVVVDICDDGDYIVYFPEVKERGLFNSVTQFHNCRGELSSDRGLFIYTGDVNSKWFGANNWEVCEGPSFWRL